MKKGKKAPRKAAHAKAGNPAPATLAEKNAAEHRRRLAEFKKKEKAKKAERDREFAELPDELKNIHSNLKFADLDIYPDGEAERLAVDLAEEMFHSTFPTVRERLDKMNDAVRAAMRVICQQYVPVRRGLMDATEAAAQKALFEKWSNDADAWRAHLDAARLGTWLVAMRIPLLADWEAHLDMVKMGASAFAIARKLFDLKPKSKSEAQRTTEEKRQRAFVTSFTHTLYGCISSDGSFKPPSEQVRKTIVARQYWECVKHHKRNVQRVEFCEWLHAIAARVEKDGRGFYSKLARQFEPRGQGVTRYAKKDESGIKFVEKRGKAREARLG